MHLLIVSGIMRLMKKIVKKEERGGKMKKILFAFLLILVVLSIALKVEAYELKPYCKLGGMSFKENNIKEGNKFFTAFGLSGVFGDKFKKEITAEIWNMDEPIDEDVEIPHNGYHISFRGNYDYDTARQVIFSPYCGISFDRWERNENNKYKDSFSSLNYFSALFGITAKYKIYRVTVGGILPVLVGADYSNPSGKLGFSAMAGLEYEKFFINLFYKRTSMGGDANQPDFQLDQRGLLIGLRF